VTWCRKDRRTAGQALVSGLHYLVGDPERGSQCVGLKARSSRGRARISGVPHLNKV
jgi:hypothetical protein